MTPEEKLKKLGIELPPPIKPLGSYVPIIRVGNLIFLSGILPLKDGKLMRKGRVGETLTLKEAEEEARTATINALSILKAELGDLSRVKRCVKLTGYISSSDDFIEQPSVLNAASELLFEVFGESGRHVRSAVGVNVLPLNSPLEIEFVFELS
ncbi:MAG: RidA family protein [Nitrospirae bacterium]|nr:RidA family protein [Nitrospirota bacterium]